jgi:hypothetical protein
MKQSTTINAGAADTIGTLGVARSRTRLEEWAVPALIFISLIPVAVSFFFINASLRLDEAQSLWQVSRDVSGILTIVAGDVHVPLYHILLHYWLVAFGNTVPVARLMSLFFYLLSIPAVYILGKRAYSARVGLIGALLISISPFMNWYGNEIRMYTLFMLLTVLNQYFFLRIWKDRPASGATWLFYALTAVLGVFSHYFFFLNLLAQSVFYLFRRSLFPEGSLRRFIGIGAVIALAFAPWIAFEFMRGVVAFQAPALPRPSTVDLFGTFSQFFFGFQMDVVNTIFLSLWPIAAIIALIGLSRSGRMTPQTEYFTLTLLIAFGATFIGSYLVTPVYVSRYLIFTIPSLYLVLISLFTQYRRSVRFLAEGTLIALMLVTLGIEVVNPTVPVKERYAEASAYLTDHATAQDVILLSAPFTVYPVRYYYRGPAPLSTLPAWNQFAYGPIPAFDPATLPQDVASSTHNYQNVYLLLSYDQGYESKVKQYFDSHYKRLSTQAFSNDLTLYVYQLRYNTSQSAISSAL